MFPAGTNRARIDETHASEGNRHESARRRYLREGVFRPAVPVNIADGERVSLNVESQPVLTDELNDVGDLLDLDFMKSCRQHSVSAPTLEEVRQILSAFTGSLAERISEERDER